MFNRAAKPFTAWDTDHSEFSQHRVHICFVAASVLKYLEYCDPKYMIPFECPCLFVRVVGSADLVAAKMLGLVFHYVDV